jgi:hypothetical protein
MPTWQHFLGVLVSRVFPMEKNLVCNIYGNPNSPQVKKLSSRRKFVEGPLNPMAVV